MINYAHRGASGYAPENTMASFYLGLALQGINQYCPMIDFVTKELVAKTHARGLTLRTFSIKTIELMHKAIDCGVDGMTINFPDKLCEALKHGTASVGKNGV